MIDDQEINDAYAAPATGGMPDKGDIKALWRSTRDTLSPLTRLDPYPEFWRAVVWGDFQEVPTGAPENTFGHDQVAAGTAVMEYLRDNIPVNVLLNVGDEIHRYYYHDDQYGGFTDKDRIRRRLSILNSTVLPQNYLFTNGNHDDDANTTEEFVKHEGHFGVSNYVVTYGGLNGGVTFIVMGTDNQGKSGQIHDGIFEWWSREVQRHQDNLIITMTHQSLRDTTENTDTDNTSQEQSQRFMDALLLPDHRVDLWFAGHSGGDMEPDTTTSQVQINGCWFVQAGTHLSGAYATATGVPTYDMTFPTFEIERGSSTVRVRMVNATEQGYEDTKEFTLEAPYPLYPSNLPTRDSRRTGDGMDYLTTWTPSGVPHKDYFRLPKGPDETNREDQTDSLSVVTGSNVVTATFVTPHGLATDDYAWVSCETAVGGIAPQAIPQFSPCVVIDANTISVRASMDATSTAVGGGNVVLANGKTAQQQTPFWAKQTVVHEPAIDVQNGLTVGSAIYLPGNGESAETRNVKSWGFGGGTAIRRKTGSEDDYSGILVGYASGAGLGEDSAVEVFEADPVDGMKDSINNFLFKRPVFSTTEQDNVVLSATPSPHIFAPIQSPVDIDVGSNFSEADGCLIGVKDGDIWMLSAQIDTTAPTNHEVQIYFEHWSDAVGTVKTPQAAVREMNIHTAIHVGEGERVFLAMSGHSASTTFNVNRVTISGHLVSRGNV